MKHSECHYIDYIQEVKLKSLHPKMNQNYNILPKDITEIPNIIFYGPPGIGKYSQVLYFLEKYSPSKLKYEKKMNINFNKEIYSYKISDIHYEVDMMLLGCNSKVLWNEIFNNIIDIINTKENKVGIIVCKNFHEIHTELLECFYSYMQKTLFSIIKIKFIFVTENISFIQNNIIKSCYILNFSRPSKNLYETCLNLKIKTKTPLNIKNLFLDESINTIPYKKTCDEIISIIINIDVLRYEELRQTIYDLLIYNYNIGESIYYIINVLIEKNLIKHENYIDVMVNTYYFLKYFNNNYRPIYHLENFILYLTKIVYEL